MKIAISCKSLQIKSSANIILEIKLPLLSCIQENLTLKIFIFIKKRSRFLSSKHVYDAIVMSSSFSFFFLLSLVSYVWCFMMLLFFFLLQAQTLCIEKKMKKNTNAQYGREQGILSIKLLIFLSVTSFALLRSVI